MINQHAPRTVRVGERDVPTDAEGYLLDLDDWSEDFARAQAQVRAMIWHFAKVWGPEYGNNHHLHTLFPVGGPQKQGNRLAGLLRTKGEH